MVYFTTMDNSNFLQRKSSLLFEMFYRRNAPNMFLFFRQNQKYSETSLYNISINRKNYNFLDCDWFKKLLFLTNSLVKLLSDTLLSDTLLSDSLLSDSSIRQSHSKM